MEFCVKNLFIQPSEARSRELQVHRIYICEVSNNVDLYTNNKLNKQLLPLGRYKCITQMARIQPRNGHHGRYLAAMGDFWLCPKLSWESSIYKAVPCRDLVIVHHRNRCSKSASSEREEEAPLSAPRFTRLDKQVFNTKFHYLAIVSLRSRELQVNNNVQHRNEHRRTEGG